MTDPGSVPPQQQEPPGQTGAMQPEPQDEMAEYRAPTSRSPTSASTTMPSARLSWWVRPGAVAYCSPAIWPTPHTAATWWSAP
jgi:hypothetical protein